MKEEYDYLPAVQKRLLGVLRKCAEQEGVEFVYYYAKNMLEYYNTAFVDNADVVTINLDIQMTDLGDELFDMVYAAEKELYGTTDGVNDHMRMSSVGPTADEKDSGYVLTAKRPRPIFRWIGSNTGKMNFRWDIFLDKIIAK